MPSRSCSGKPAFGTVERGEVVGRRHSRPNNDRPGVLLESSPGVLGAIEILVAIAGRFDHDDSHADRGFDRGEHGVPELHRNVPIIRTALGVQLDQDDVPGPELRRRVQDRPGRVEHATDHRRLDDGLRLVADTDSTDRLGHADHLSKDGRPMIGPCDVRNQLPANMLDPDRQVLVCQIPVPLDIADGDPGADCLERPDRDRPDPVGRVVQVSLRRLKARRSDGGLPRALACVWSWPWSWPAAPAAERSLPSTPRGAC